MALNDIQIRALKPDAKPYRKADGSGLFLEVRPNGSRLWRFAYRFQGKQKLLAFGAYPDVTLARARERRREVRALLAEGVDPAAKSKAEKAALRARTEDTFAKIADEMLRKLEREGRAKTTLLKKRWLIGMANDAFGDQPIRDITAAEILVPLRKVEAVGNYETARRLRAVIGQVFRYAISTARADNDPTFGLRGALITPKVRHMAAVTDRSEFAGLVRAVWAYQGGIETQIALKLMALLYPRPGELRLASWEEFDLQKRTWTIPAPRMKMRREHVKPLSVAAVELLEALKAHTGNAPFAFRSTLAPGKPISENTLNGALRRLGFTKDEATSHGFRASASSLLNECGMWQDDAIEAELGHKEENEVRRAYHRSRYWEERVRMAEWWAGEVLKMAED